MRYDCSGYDIVLHVPNKLAGASLNPRPQDQLEAIRDNSDR